MPIILTASEISGLTSPKYDSYAANKAYVDTLSGNAFISGVAEINMLSDVDTQSDAPSRDQVLKWNGTNWIPAAYDATFVFTIASFSEGISATQLIGTGVWKAATAMSFTATYNNGPPDNSDVYVGYNSTSYYKSGVIGAMDGAGGESGDNDVAVSYPHSKDQYLRFRLSSNAGSDKDTDDDSAIYFRNYIYYGKASKNSGFSEADVEGLAGSTISNDTTQSWGTIAPGVGEYLVLAHPASYSTLDTGDDYEDDGDSDFRHGGMTVAMIAPETVSLTNSDGYTENYKVYASEDANLGSATFDTRYSTINEIYYGVTTTTSGYDEDDVEGLANSPITDDSTQTWNEVTADAGEYLLFCFPKRWGEKGTDYTFYDNGTGFEAAFEDAETVSVTNAKGWTEDFYVYRSENPGLGAITIRTS